MMGTMAMRQPENWLYEIWQKGHDSPCYVMVPNAKDLVKSHLMIAVREEVEVLKEKISELMDKINQLEVENTILKSNMSQETLQQLQMQTQLQITGNGATGNNMIAAAPQQQQQQQPSANNAVVAVASTATGVAGAATAITPTSAAAVPIVTPTAASAVSATAAAITATEIVEGGDDGAVATTNGPMS